MELKDYLRVLRRSWLLIALATVLTTAAAAAFTFTATQQYQSTARLFVSTPTSAEDNQLLAGGQFSQQRVKSYATLLEGDEVARRVIAELGISESPAQLASKISTSIEADTVVLSVSVTDSSPQRAQQLTDTVTTVFADYVEELETPAGQETAPIRASVVDRPTLPASPISPQPVRNIALGVVLGLLLGTGVAILREVLDNRVRSVADLTAVSGHEIPLLGTIYYDKRAVQRPFVRGLSGHDPRVEAFRVLRTNLAFVDPKAESKVYTITSSLPSEGKTSTAANLSLLLAVGGERVLLIEADLRRPRAAAYVNVEGKVGVTTVLLGQLPLEDATQGVLTNLDFLGSGKIPPNPAELLGSSEMKDLLAQARADYDIVLIDAPPLLPVADAAILASITDGAILVVRHGVTTVDQYAGSIDRLDAVGARLCGTVLSMAPTPKRGSADYGYGYGYAPATRRSQGKSQGKAAGKTQGGKAAGRRGRDDKSESPRDHGTGDWDRETIPAEFN